MTVESNVERGNRGVRVTLVAFVVAALGVVLPPASHPQDVLAAPANTVSRYEKTINGGTLWNQGCNQAGTSGAVIIDFAQPWYQSGTYGTWNWSNQFFSIAQITNAAESWLQGFAACRSSATVILAVGTSNDFGYTGSGHGAAWAGMVNTINAWIASPPSWIPFEQAAGAIDSELGWSSASVTEPWATSYSNTESCTYACGFYYNYGDANSCPPYGGCHAGWNQQQVWYMSWGAIAALPFPEIYWYQPGYGAAVNAAQWASINASYSMSFRGALTQKAASGSASTNSPANGWQELASATGQSPYYSSDITWAN